MGGLNLRCCLCGVVKALAALTLEEGDMKKEEREWVEVRYPEMDGDTEIIARILMGIEASLQRFVDEFDKEEAELAKATERGEE